MTTKIKDCRILRTFDRTDFYEIHAENSRPLRACVHCQSRSLNGHGSVRIRFHHTPEDKPVLVVMDNVRHQCVQCAKTMMEPISALHANYRASRELVKFLIDTSRNAGLPELAAASGLNVRTVRRILDNQLIDKYLQARQEQPLAVGINRIWMGRSRLLVCDMLREEIIEARSSTNLLNLTDILNRFDSAGKAPEAYVVDFDHQLLMDVDEHKAHDTRLLINLTSVSEMTRSILDKAIQKESEQNLQVLPYEVLKRLFDPTDHEEDGVGSNEEVADNWPLTLAAAAVHQAVQEAISGRYADGWQVIIERITGATQESQFQFESLLLLWDVWEEEIRASINTPLCRQGWIEGYVDCLLNGKKPTFRHLREILLDQSRVDQDRLQVA